ncbi:hypothetical protein [Burkholderia sp. JP2-270]|uniref:hypothetical protein n=1 Tax=Burkholderia sp. JP2-270 TaxID=2217913 RepID=UPI001EF781C0|nr:hypothetical protein [Burkholderia sp. JP2-270]
MIFDDRRDAANQLASVLQAYRGEHPLVLAIPRGALILGSILATRLHGDLRRLIERELGACDTQLVLDMLSRVEGDWNEIGPIFKMLAQRIVDATVVTFDTWPIAPVLEDAARYRKLVQLAKWIEVDGQDYVQFPKIHSPSEHRDFLFEDRIAIAVDAMPDRDRW